MASLKTIQKRREKALQELEETERKLQERQEEIQLGLGEEIIKVLKLDYDDLDLVKDRKAMAEKIKNHLNDNFYQETTEHFEEENQRSNENENNKYNEIPNKHLVNNQ